MLDRGLLFLLLQVVGVLGQECGVGKYGGLCEQNCSRYCAPYSGQDVHCDRHSGKCSEGCIPGWYGDQCQLSCSRNCQQHICSQQTGHCTLGCKGNNMGDFCETSAESGPKQDASEQSQEPASTPLAAILVPVFVLLIISIIIIITVSVYRRRRRRRKSNRPSDDVEQLEPLNPGGVDTDLIVACREGKLKAVKDTLDKRPEDINKKGCGGMTPLLWAARRGHREVVDMLVRQAADVTVVDGAGNNILHWACYGGHVAMVKHVVSKKMVDINSKGQGGRTPLMWAAREGRGDFFQILVSKGGLPSQVDKEGNNILLLACSGANVEIVESIISHADDNMDIDGRGLSDRTPLMVAAHKGCRNIFELLVNRGANQELFDDVNDNVLHLACQGGNVDIVSRVLELGKVDKNSRGQCSRTPLMMAARLGHKEIFHLLVSEGADASLLDDEKNNILHLACEGGRIDMVEYVLSLNIVNISARNKRNETATMLATEGGDVFNLLESHGHLMNTDLQTQDTDLHVACREGKQKAVKDILDRSPEDINRKGGSGMTPLLWAARRGHREVVDMLVRQAADVTVVDGAGNNILHWACYGGHVEMVKYVVSKKMVDIDSKGQGGRTPLMWAAREGRGEFFNILESEGGPPSQVDKEGNNILLLACSGGNVDIVESILSHADDNFDIDGRGQARRTPLMVAAHKGCQNIFELLVNRGANQELFDDVNDNVLHLACQGGNVDIVSHVLKLGKVDINSRGQCSRTPLMMAARLGHEEIFHLLVSEGADASLLDDENNNILHLTCEGGRIDMVEYVLSLNIVNINARNKRNKTATMLATKGGDVCNLLMSHGDLMDTDLHVACREGKLKAVKDILDKSPEDINKKGGGGMTPLLWAARRGHREVVDMLVRQAADVNVVDVAGNNILHWACYGGHVAMVKYVVSKKMVDIDSKGQGGRTPLMWAAREGRGEFFEILESEGCPPSQVDKEGNNILLLACSGGNVEIVKSILSHADDNFDIDGRGLSGRTPLMVAAHKGCQNIFELLVNRGANQELFDDVNDNVLHLACQGGNVDIVSRVLELGKVDKNSRGQCSRTPLMMAARLGHEEIFHLLVSEGADASLLDDENNNILHLTCEGGRIDMVEYVLSLNIVNINARNEQNETATMLATKGGEVCNLLESHGGLSK